MNISSNIIDKPLIAGGRDLLGTDKYKEALVRFISNANMPTTVAIQGEWGSGKTSMMNQLRFQLCESSDHPDKEFYGVWINTWQYSLMKSPDETLINIITGLTKEVLSIIKDKHESSTEQLTKKIGSILSVVARTAAKTAISTSGMDGGEIVDGIFTGKDTDTAIIALRNALQGAIEKCLEADKKAGKTKKGFIFFVDDLDRIDPPVAVQILELIKNIFEVDNCLFILAIDYEVVVKGLEPKFGKLTEKNEREFRSFFDKIIQLPFSMPVTSYNIDQFLIESLKGVRYIDETLLQDEDFKQLLTEMATRSVGTNPRGIKRLINTLSLIQIMNELEVGDLGEKRHEKLLNFGFVCIQIAFPSFYYLVVEEPNFAGWDEKLANKLRLKKLSDEQVEQLKDLEEFDEEWETIVYRACINDAYLAARAFDISSLLNVIRALVPDGMPFEETIQKVLTLSSVTSVSLDKGSVKKQSNRVRYEGWSDYQISQEEMGVDGDLQAFMKALHDEILEMFADKAEAEYAPKFLSFNRVNALSKSKKFCIIHPRKSVLTLLFMDSDIENTSEAAEKAFPGKYKIISNGTVEIKVTNKFYPQACEFSELLEASYKNVE